MRRNSKSSNSLLSLTSSVGNSSTGRKSVSGGVGIARLPFLSKTKGNMARVANSISFVSLNGRRSTSNISTAPKQNSIRRNSKSMTSLKTLEKETSSPSCFSDLVTHHEQLVLEQIDETLGQIGLIDTQQIPRRVSSSTICELSEHEEDEFFHSFIDESSPPSSSQGNQIQRFNRDDLYRVCKIGRGAFSNVDMVLDNKRKKRAFKALDPARLNTSENFITAAIDLAMEAKMLSELEHENIIQLRGVCSDSFSSSYLEGDRNGYFLVFDLLSDILSDRLDRWRKENRKKPASDNKWKFGKSKVDTMAMYERMRYVVLGIVKGMIYLQENGIVIRDLKPANVGFDEDGNVRLFDFGMARKLEDCDPNEMCGSPRYMPPEVMAGKGYSFKSDVYSFGVILYEMCSLNVAYDSIRKYDDREEFNRLVIEENMRPKLNKIACPLTSQLIEDCWQGDPTQRPSFDEIYARIIDITSEPFEITG